MKKAIFVKQEHCPLALVYKGNADVITAKWAELRQRWQLFTKTPKQCKWAHDDAFGLERAGKKELWFLQTTNEL